MPYRIEFKKSAGKALKRVSANDLRSIRDVIEALKTDPHPAGHVALRGYSNPTIYRVRCGDYRILYTIKEDFLLILVVAVGLRSDVYSNFARSLRP